MYSDWDHAISLNLCYRSACNNFSIYAFPITVTKCSCFCRNDFAASTYFHSKMKTAINSVMKMSVRYICMAPSLSQEEKFVWFSSCCYWKWWVFTEVLLILKSIQIPVTFCCQQKLQFKSKFNEESLLVCRLACQALRVHRYVFDQL